MESMRTGIIKFNINDTKRKYSGKARNFNVKNIVKAINNPSLQEQVKNGEITGFFSHLPRIKYGIDVKDAIFDGAKLVPLDPCFKTIYLKAYDDGTIEHQAEFLNNEYGIKAFNLLKDNLGGFSSAISQKTNGEYIFHGFDYVRAPNFAENRPYSVMFDDIDCDDDNSIIFLDEITADVVNQEKLLFLLDHIEYIESINKSLQQENKLLIEASENLSLQNQELLDETVSLNMKLTEAKNNARFDNDSLDKLKEEAAIFDSADIVTEEINDKSKKNSYKEPHQIRNILSKLF